LVWLWMAARPTSWKFRLAWKSSEAGLGYTIHVDEICVEVFLEQPTRKFGGWGTQRTKRGVLLEGFFEEGTEPEEIYVLVARGLIESDEQSVAIVDSGGEKGLADE
jgi:hypothetical protein